MKIIKYILTYILVGAVPAVVIYCESGECQEVCDEIHYSSHDHSESSLPSGSSLSLAYYTASSATYGT